MLIQAPTYAPPFTPVETKPNRRDVLLRAIGLLDERGWSNGIWLATDGTMCILGAVGCAAIETGYTRRSVQRWEVDTDYDWRRVNIHAASSMFFDGANETELLYGWNDKIGRTKEEVQEALRRMADGMRAFDAIR